MNYFIVDVETTGLYPYKGDRIFSIAIGWPDGRHEIHRVDGKDRVQGRRRVQAILSSSLPRVAHNAKFELGMFVMSGFDPNLRAIWHDTMILSQIVNNLTPSHSLDYLATLWADYPTATDDLISRLAKETGRYDKIPDKIMREYQRTDIERTLLLFEFLHPKVLSSPREYTDYQNELELIKVTQREEETGIVIDRKSSASLLGGLEDEVEKVSYDLQRELGFMGNLNSPQVIKHILFNMLKFPVLEFNEETGNAVVDKDVLFEYRKRNPHPVLELILKSRSYTKASGMIKNYLKNCSEEGIVHPNIQTNRAVTGRQACNNPNMQNVSKEINVKNPYPVPLRKCFRARPGFVLMFFDYAGIEMRLIIEATREPEMLQILKEGKDPHNIAAAIFYEDKYLLEEDRKKKKSIRDAAKNAHFALSYGAGAGKIALTLDIPPEEAVRRVTNYKLRFPLIGKFSQTTAYQVIKQGFVITSFGRKLRINREKAYAACNYLIQGTAAGIIKRAQVALTRKIDQKYGWANLRPLLPIHDELVIEMSRALLPRMKEVYTDIRESMITMPDIIVPLEIEGKISTNTWFDAKELKV